MVTIGKLIWILLAILGDLISWAYLLVFLLTGSPRFLPLIVSKDEAFNTISGGNGNETISRRAARARARGEKWGCVLCRFLDRIDKDHCARQLTKVVTIFKD